MFLSDLAIRRPIGIIMAVLIIFALGTISFSRLAVDLLPNLTFPYIVVTTSYSGVGPEEMENLISKPIEEAVSTVNNVNKINSTSMEGLSQVGIQFNWGTNMDTAAADVRAKIDRVRARLPEDADIPVVVKIDPSASAILVLGVTGADLMELRKFGDDVLQDRLEKVAGVASIDVYGGKERQIVISVDQGKLQSFGIGLAQLSEALTRENVNTPGGLIRDGNNEILVRTQGQFQTVEEIKNIIIISSNKVPVRIRDVANVTDSYKEQRIFSKVDQQGSISIQIRKQPDANTVNVIEGINRELVKVRQEYPHITIGTAFDQAKLIRQSISTVEESAVLGAMLAVFVVYVFLRDVRSTLIIGLSIPISIIATFVVMYFKGLTLNIMSLGGLALGVGMIVDDAIVVLENVYRHMENGKEPISAARFGTTEIAGAVIATTLTVMVVFMPIAFVSGMAGQLFRDFALAVVFSIGASLLMAVTVVPMLCAQLLKVTHQRDKKANWCTRALDACERGLTYLDSSYRNLIAWSLNNRRKVFAIAIITLIMSGAMLPLIGTELMPVTDNGNFNVSIKTPMGTSVEKTMEMTALVEEELLSDPNIEHIFSTIGASGSYGTRPASNTSQITVALVDKAKRHVSTQDVITAMRIKVSGIPGTQVRFNQTDIISQILTRGRPPVEVKVSGTEVKTLGELANAVKLRLGEVEGIRDINISMDEASPELQITVDRVKAADFGLTTTMIANTLKTASNGTTATQFHANGEKKEIDIFIQYRENQRDNLEAIGNTIIVTPDGSTVRLKDVAKLQLGKGPNVISREDRERRTTVTANVFSRDKGSAAKEVEEILRDLPLPPGYSITFGGDQQDMQDSFKSLMEALILAILLVYMVLAAQFESLVHPLAIMFSLPLAIVGVILALLISGKAFGVTAFIGLVMLVGIVVKNAILLVDYTNTLRERGVERREAILQAGPTRLRPILMTTLATILGMLPMALGIGVGSEANAPMAIAVIGGLSTSTLLTLIVVPVAYTLLDDLSVRYNKIRRTKTTERSA
jgi:hydrophobic/amphiphilic exporter-1 (mainly G- bacteria), HAE1 family